MPKEITLYHNPRCSKSRAALQLLEQSEATVTVIDYQKNPPDAQALKLVLEKLNLRAEELMRTGEAQYKSLQLRQKDLSEDELIDLMVQYPVLIERPIVVTQDAAAIGRPIDNIIDLLDHE